MAAQTAHWDPRDPSVLADQRRAYDEMRERCPVAHSDFLDWSLFRHEDLAGVLADPTAYSNASRHPAIPNGLDPPAHTRYRRMLEPYFATVWMESFEPRCRRIAIDLVQPLVGRDDVAFIADFAEPFPLQALCAFLGWPPDSWERLRGWNHGNQEAAFSQDRPAGKTLALTFSGYVKEALQAHRKVGVDASADVTSSLMTIDVAGDPVSDDDIVSVLRNWTAGQGTVAAALGIVIHYLAQHPEVQQLLRGEPAMLPTAIEEILRTDGPLVANRRTTTRDVEIGGRSIRAGEKLSLMWIAANRDGRRFDAPDEVDLSRDPGDNLLFGAGIHDCLGAPLARLELRVALEELLSRTSRIDLVGAEPPRRDTYPSNGFRSMMVRIR